LSSEEEAAEDEFSKCAAIQINGVFSFIGRPDTDAFRAAYNEAWTSYQERHTRRVDFFGPGEVPLDHGAETFKMRIANALKQGDEILPFTSNIAKRVKERRLKGVAWTDEEELRDSETLPWCFDSSSSEDSSSSSEDESTDDDVKRRAKRQKRC